MIKLLSIILVASAFFFGRLLYRYASEEINSFKSKIKVKEIPLVFILFYCVVSVIFLFYSLNRNYFMNLVFIFFACNLIFGSFVEKKKIIYLAFLVFIFAFFILFAIKKYFFI